MPAIPAVQVSRPTREQLAAACGSHIADLGGRGLNVLFCGINPSLYSAAVGHHFARPGNRFWPALHGGGFTQRVLRPDEQGELPALGLGITNVVARATARADELTRAELIAAGLALSAKVQALAPRWLAVLGVTAYRTAFGNPAAQVGRQDEVIGQTRLWVLPNPSGLNAHWTPPQLAQAFSALRLAARPD